MSFEARKETPPESPVKSGGGTLGRLAATLEALVRPGAGEWYAIHESESGGAVRGVVTNLRKRHPDFEIVSRVVAGEVIRVYARLKTKT